MDCRQVLVGFLAWRGVLSRSTLREVGGFTPEDSGAYSTADGEASVAIIFAQAMYSVPCTQHELRNQCLVPQHKVLGTGSKQHCDQYI